MWWLLIKVLGYVIIITFVHKILYNIYGISSPIIVEDTAHKIRSTYDSIFKNTTTTQNRNDELSEDDYIQIARNTYSQNSDMLSHNKKSNIDNTIPYSDANNTMGNSNIVNVDNNNSIENHNIKNEINEETLMGFLSKLNEDFNSRADDTKSIISVEL